MDPSSSYIKCLLFNGPNLQTYFVMALQAQMEEHGCSYSDFYHIDGNKVYVKDVENIGFIRNITEASKKEVGYNFYLQHSDNLKVKAKHYKDAIGELIFRLTEISIHRYYYDEFIDKDKISNGDRFAFIPTIKEGNISRYLNRGEANKINAQFGYDLLTDIKGQTETTRSGRFGGVYAFSNRQIALLIPVIIENSVISKDGQIEIDPGLPRTLLTEPSLKQESPTRSQGVGLGESPRQGLEESFMLHKKLDVPGTSGEFLPRSHLSYTAVSQGTEKCVSAAQNVQAGPSTWSQPMNPLLSQSTSGNKWMSSTQFTQPGPSGLSWTQSRPSSSKGADESMLIEIRGQQVRHRPSLTPSPIAWDDSTFLNLEVSNEEPEKQQVTDESDRKSSDECSEAKSQDSKSPEKKHGGGLQKIKKLLSSPFKKQYGVNLKRHDVGRDTTRSTPETPVTEKPPVSKLFSSFPARIRARSNPSSAVTSPTHEGASGGLKPLTSDERKELRLFLSPELQKKLDSNSFSPGKERLLYLTHTPEGKS